MERWLKELCGWPHTHTDLWNPQGGYGCQTPCHGTFFRHFGLGAADAWCTGGGSFFLGANIISSMFLHFTSVLHDRAFVDLSLLTMTLWGLQRSMCVMYHLRIFCGISRHTSYDVTGAKQSYDVQAQSCKAPTLKQGLGYQGGRCYVAVQCCTGPSHVLPRPKVFAAWASNGYLTQNIFRK